MNQPPAAPSFDPWAASYDRYRPGYPDALFATIAERLSLPAHPRVADLGAGTGRATLAMAGHGWDVTAVEPGPQMLAVLRERAAEAGLTVASTGASAEATNLPDASFDVVTAAQAFHWFDKPAALSEAARILRPGGGVALFWNTRDADASVLLADFGALLERATTGSGWWRDRVRQMDETQAALGSHPDFGAPELVELRHTERVTPDAFVEMAFTASQVQALAREAQERLRDELRRLLARGGHDRQPTLSIPYRIDLWIARRSGE
jgi:ubiquinone/menaquinone biosynthesis C-methylase UbiE